MPGEDQVIVAFEGTPVYFGGNDDNNRKVDTIVEFPPQGFVYERITLGVQLSCHNENCDWWDRFGNFGIVRDAGTPDETVIEIARFITPYRVGAVWNIDLTDLAPLLTGTQTVRAFVDTWVGPGHENGDGWVIDASFQFLGGTPSKIPVAVVPVWSETSFQIGDPDLPIVESVPTVTVDVPVEARSIELRSMITGHGQGNAENCAEFCRKNHGFQVGDKVVERVVWRDDCDQTPVQGQQGTWTYPRAGWCPGAEVFPWIEDITDAVVPGEGLTIAYGLEPYENSCRPTSPVCEGCALGTGCDWDGSNHTQPRYRISALVVAYR